MREKQSIPPPDSTTASTDPLIQAIEKVEEKTVKKYAKRLEEVGTPRAKARRTKVSKTSQNRIRILRRQKEALQLRIAGHSLAAIAEHLKYSGAQGAQQAIEAALKLTITEEADDVRKIERARLDAMLVKQYERAVEGDTFALDACLKIMGRRAKLDGIDAPEKRELTGKNGQPLAVQSTVVAATPEEVREAMRQINAEMNS